MQRLVREVARSPRRRGAARASAGPACVRPKSAQPARPAPRAWSGRRVGAPGALQQQRQPLDSSSRAGRRRQHRAQRGIGARRAALDGAQQRADPLLPWQRRRDLARRCRPGRHPSRAPGRARLRSRFSPASKPRSAGAVAGRRGRPAGRSAGGAARRGSGARPRARSAPACARPAGAAPPAGGRWRAGSASSTRGGRRGSGGPRRRGRGGVAGGQRAGLLGQRGERRQQRQASAIAACRGEHGRRPAPASGSRAAGRSAATPRSLPVSSSPATIALGQVRGGTCWRRPVKAASGDQRRPAGLRPARRSAAKRASSAGGCAGMPGRPAAAAGGAACAARAAAPPAPGPARGERALGGVEPDRLGRPLRARPVRCGLHERQARTAAPRPRPAGRIRASLAALRRPLGVGGWPGRRLGAWPARDRRVAGARPPPSVTCAISGRSAGTRKRTSRPPPSAESCQGVAMLNSASAQVGKPSAMRRAAAAAPPAMPPAPTSASARSCSPGLWPISMTLRAVSGAPRSRSSSGGQGAR